MKRTHLSTYIERPGGWLGFGRADNDQPDLLQSVWRLGFWRLTVCRVCLTAHIRDLQARIDRYRETVRQAQEIANRRQKGDG